MREFTRQEFARNLVRARSLIGAYELVRTGGGGRRSVATSDVLRAATVFLHSSMEEVVRNLFLWRLPEAAEAVLDEIPLAGTSPTKRVAPFLLGKLAAHRGRFVENVIRESIDAYVDHMNVNNTNELSHCLEMVGLHPGNYAAFLPLLQELIARRHQIVHQMDRNRAIGQGHHQAQSISVRRVRLWAENLELFVDQVLQDVPG